MINKALINRLDRNFDEALKTIEFKYVKSDLTPKLKAERRAKADADDFEFCKIYFPQIFDDGWNPLHIEIKKSTKGYHTISGSRFFGKSAFTYITKLVKPLCLGGTGMIGLGLRNQDVAANRSAALIRLIKRNEMLKHDYDIKIQQDKVGDYIINNKNFITFGYREGLRNFFDEEFKRFEIIVLDDLFNSQTVNSEVDNTKILRFVENECTGQLEDDGLLIWLFNYITTQSPGYLYAEKHPENHFNLPALNKDGKTNWPESKKWTTEKLIAKSKELAYDVWMGDWMNNPQQKGEEFDTDWLRFVNPQSSKVLATISFSDPAHGQSPQACYKSIITMSYLENKKYLIQDIYLRKEPYQKFFSYVHALAITMPNWKTLLFENDFNQWDAAAGYFKLWKQETKKTIPVQKFNTRDLKTHDYGSDKESRIRNLILPFETGEILINQDIIGTKDFELWKSQYIGFGKAKGKLDGLDATASAYILFPRYVVRGTFKPLKKRFTKEQSWLDNR